MLESHLGELYALGTAVCWTVTVMAFEASGRRIGSFPVNIIRLCMAFLMFCALSALVRGNPLPVDASAHNWLWLSLSGLVGFVMGDLLLFRSFVVVGSRVAMLMMALVPPVTAVIGWGVLGETLSGRELLGMLVTIAGIAMVVLERNPSGAREIRFRHPAGGMLLAFGGAVGQATGLVLSKYGMNGYSPFFSTQIRVIAAIGAFAVILLALRGRRRSVLRALGNGKALLLAGLGATFGPFLGVSLSLLAVRHTQTGVASTIMALVPVLVIAPAAMLFRERVTTREVIGAFIAVSGVAVLFM
ncbi:DMT family transporter [Candidatus Fermentibacterales bacterium]|nr:DMT family transporter [Candidatus Fermentibacterales bacterium]